MRLEPIDPEQILAREIKPSQTTPIKYQNYRTNDSGLVIIDKNEDLTFSRNFLPLYTTTLNKKSFDTVVKAEFEEFISNISNTPVTFLQTQLDEIRAQRDSLLAARDLDRNKIAELTDTIESLQQQIEDILNTQSASTSVTDFKVIFAVNNDATRASLVCILYQNQLYPIAEGGASRVVNACLEILRLNGKQESGISIDVMNSYTNALIPGQAIYLIPGQAGQDGLERISFGTIRYLGVEDIKQIVSGDLTPLTQNG